MKIVRIIGGLGNQLFQYAVLVALRKRTGDEVKIDLSAMSTYGLHNGFELQDIFNITASIATPTEVKTLGRFYKNYRQWQICHHFFPWWKKEFVERKYTKFYFKLINDANKDRLYDGYWQCPMYFDDAREEILKEYTYKEDLDECNKKIANKMLNDDKSVSIHIRRGDYLKAKKYAGICGIEYYLQAIKIMQEKLGNNFNTYIFSNDMEWCKKNILPMLNGSNVMFIDWNIKTESYKDMRLMSFCRANIIAASSFSWWGAYLNQRKDQIVIAPKKWINLDLEYEIQMPKWIKV
ncbi:alpha-1,2-fucosyltransferase [Bacteroides uniformis]|uniref:alpha-1,2-fucosyltransferase n=1 Tax=Bacteroides uniformis TaxID=820 RepID=UPI0039B36BD0